MIPIPQNLSVYPAQAFDRRGAPGAFLAPSDQLSCGVDYVLAMGAKPAVLSLDLQEIPPHVIRSDSALGTALADIYPDARLTLTTPEGRSVQVLLLVETARTGEARQLWVAPLAPLRPGTPYHLTRIDPDGAPQALGRLANLAFVPGTHIALSTGSQVPVENLKAGDRVLTRDAGPQPLLWVGRTPQMAHGARAPVRIQAGTLNTINALVLSPDHRLFFYQRTDPLGMGTPECMVRAQHLVNHRSITQTERPPYWGYHLLLEGHHLIFAEGIAVETLRINNLTQPALPATLADQGPALLRQHRASSPDDFEIDPLLLPRGDTAALLEAAIAG